MRRLYPLLSAWLPRLLTGGCILAMLPVVISGFFNHPSPPGDFQNAEWTSFLAGQKDLYLHWSGRYFSNLTAQLTPVHWHSFSAYKWLLVIQLLVFIASSTYLMYAGLRRFAGLGGSTASAIATAGTAVMINNFESLAEGFFWYTSAVTYVIAVITLYWLILLLLWIERHPEKATTPALVLAIVLAAATIGSNETMLAACDGLAGLAWLYYRKHGSRKQRQWYHWLLASCVLFSIVALAAPGNFERQVVHPRNVLMVPATWMYTSQKTFFHWITERSLLLFSLVVLILSPSAQPATRLGLPKTFLLPPAIILFMSLPAHYVLGTVPPPRVVNVIYCFFLPAWLLFLLQLKGVFSLLFLPDDERRKVRSELLGLLALILFLVVIKVETVRQGKLVVAAKGLLKGIPQAYDAELNARYQYIRSQPTDTVCVPSLRHVEGNVLYFQDIIPVKSSVTSAQYGHYFGKKVVWPDSVCSQ